MLKAIAVVPSAPVLVPELAGPGADTELTELRRAVTEAVSALPRQWVAVGAGPGDTVIGPAASGTFAGFGADVPVRLSPTAAQPVELPLCALLAGWLRGRLQPDCALEVHVVADIDAARIRGTRLRARIDTAPEPIGVLVLADGANTLTPSAPGGHHPDDAAVQAVIDDALAQGDTAPLTGLPEQVVGRAAFAALAGLAGAGPHPVTTLYRDAPYGVGYFAGVWQIGRTG